MKNKKKNKSEQYKSIINATFTNNKKFNNKKQKDFDAL